MLWSGFEHSIMEVLYIGDEIGWRESYVILHSTPVDISL